MLKKLLISVILILVAYFAINSTNFIDKLKNNFLSKDQKQLIKRYFLPYKVISQQKDYILELEKEISKKKRNINSFIYTAEIDFKESSANIKTKKKELISLSDNKTMIKYDIASGFYTGIFGERPGGYFDFHKDNLFILSARGILSYTDDLDKLYFQQIKNNINEFINFNNFKKQKHKDSKIILNNPQLWNSTVMPRDLLIHDDKIYISYVEEIDLNCWNLSVMHGKIDYETIKFEKLFSFNKCDGSNNPRYSNQTGGRIVYFDKNHILLSVGVLGDDDLAQNLESIKGKIIKINLNNSDYEIISMGHRNPQGLLFDNEQNYILATEHGPRGGDEINLIDINEIDQNKPINFGWAIASAGEHYCFRDFGKTKEPCATKYANFPLYKSHSKHGFVEPLISFVPSIAISEISKIGKKKYVVGGMGHNREGDKSLHYFELNNENKITNLKRVKVFNRVRDMLYKDNKLYLFFEEPSSIGVIPFE